MFVRSGFGWAFEIGKVRGGIGSPHLIKFCPFFYSGPEQRFETGGETDVGKILTVEMWKFSCIQSRPSTEGLRNCLHQNLTVLL